MDLRKTLMIVFVIFLAFALYNSPQNIFTISEFKPNSLIFSQYTGRPSCNGQWCNGWPEGGIYNSDVSFLVGENTFDFKVQTLSVIELEYCKILPDGAVDVTELYSDDDGCQHWSYRVPGRAAFYTCDQDTLCAEEADSNRCDPHSRCDNPNRCVSKGDSCNAPRNPSAWTHHPEIVEIVETDFGGKFSSTSDPNTGIINRGCFEVVRVFKDGSLIDELKSVDVSEKQYTADDGKSKILIDLMTFENFEHGTDCRSVGNNYVLTFPDDSVQIDIGTPIVNKDLDNDISLDVKVTSNIGSLDGELVLDYSVSTLIGDFEKSESKEVHIEHGVNNFIIDIPVGDLSGEFTIRPSVKILYPTTTLVGTVFPSTKALVSSDTHIDLGLAEGVESNVVVLNQEQKIYYRFENNTCTSIILEPNQKTNDDYIDENLCKAKIQEDSDSDEDSDSGTGGGDDSGSGGGSSEIKKWFKDCPTDLPTSSCICVQTLESELVGIPSSLIYNTEESCVSTIPEAIESKFPSFAGISFIFILIVSIVLFIIFRRAK